MARRRVARGRIGATLAWAMPLWLLGTLLLVAAWIDRTDPILGVSVLCGGLAFAIPHCWYTWYVLGALREGATPVRIYGRFRRGEMNKWGFTALACALVFTKVQPLNYAGFFLAFLAVMVLSWANAARLAYVTNEQGLTRR